MSRLSPAPTVTLNRNTGRQPRPAPRLMARGLPWPLPAVLTWAGAWLCWMGARALGLPAAPAFGLALVFSVVLAWSCSGPWRRCIAAAGFPLSALALGSAGTMPPWIWLLLLLPVLAAYPPRAWRDAPFFPTPADALDGLPDIVGQPARVLDAGCGLGDGLLALRRLWPQAELSGLEWSAALAGSARWRCRGQNLHIRRGDMWAASWAGQDLVYVFQRPESMARAFEKARSELAAGAWLVSLEFAVPGQQPWASLQGPGRRPVWIYRFTDGPGKPAFPDSIQTTEGRYPSQAPDRVSHTGGN